MHRTKVRVVEEALDANNTIAQANRADFDRAGVRVVNFMSAPGAGKTALLEHVVRDLPGVRWACSRATSRARWTRTARVAARAGHAAEHRPGFGGECHLDANMVRTALPAAARRHRPARDRERATSSARRSSGSARTRASWSRR